LSNIINLNIGDYMNILVTGGSGFIGTRLVENLLKDGHSVKIYDKVKSEKYPDIIVEGDVRDRAKLVSETKDIDIIYNLAAEHADNVSPLSLYDEVNVGGAKNIIEAAKINGINKIIFTSSVAVYGLDKGTPDESFDPEPFNEYGSSKLKAEKVFKDWHEEDSKNRTLIMLRPSAIFGEGNRGNIYNLIKQVYSGKFIMIGKGDNKKSIGYVGNIAGFLAFLAENKSGFEIYNFADKPDMSAREMVDSIQKSLGRDKKIPAIPYFIGIIGGYTFDLLSMITGKKFTISSIRIKKFAADTTINTDKLQNCSFNLPYSFKDGLERTVKFEFGKE
jgi:nucleoside-diphosphate-sugar epimerase